MTVTDPALAADEAALMAAVCAAPDDDLPRLVLADWLEEHGQARRAEFVRRQCESARDSATGRAWWADPVYRLFNPWRGFDEVARVLPWSPSYPPDLAGTDRPVVVVTSRECTACCVAWHRGFPAAVGCTERQWHRHHESFPGPLAAVCLSGASQCWGSYLVQPGAWGLVSLVNGDLKVPPTVRRYNVGVEAARRILWPRVREFAGPCTLARLRALATSHPANSSSRAQPAASAAAEDS